MPIDVCVDPSEIDVAKSLPKKTTDAIFEAMDGKESGIVHLVFPPALSETTDPYAWCRDFPREIADKTLMKTPLVYMMEIMLRKGYKVYHSHYDSRNNFIELRISKMGEE